MLGATHALAGALVATMVAPDQGVAAAMLGAVAGLIPDIDEPHSTLGSKIPLLSVVFKLVLGHRGLTHTTAFSVVVGGLGWVAGPFSGLAAARCALIAVLGSLSHVILDSLTPSGTQALWPLPARWAGPIRTGSLMELPITGILAAQLWMRLRGA